MGELTPNDKKPRFRGDIEGLRAIAVVSVLLFHAGVPHLAGGFIGVDVFFVISGFLITGLMFRELASSGKMNVGAFYARRCRRILPSASLVLVVTMIAAWFIMPLLTVHQTAVDALAAAAYVANWHFIAEGTNYLAASTSHSPFLHYWSLAVEEQFYLVWPALAIAVAWVARRLRFSLAGSMALALLAVMVMSFAYSLHETSYLPTTAYLATGARVWQFAAGALLAILVETGWFRQVAAHLRFLGLAAGWAGLATVLGAVFLFDRNTPYPGTAALLPTTGTVLLIFAGSVRQTAVNVGRVLALPPVRWVGRLSFAWYLTHWPVLVLAQVIDPALTWQQDLLLVLGSALPAMVVMWVVERPIRFSLTIQRRTSSGIAVGAIAMSAALAVSLGLGTRAILELGGVSAFADVPPLTSVFSKGPGTNSGSVTPTPLNAVADRPYPDSCIVQPTLSVTPSNCVFGDPHGIPVVLFGDSHAQQWLPALEKLAPKLHWKIYMFTKAGCPAPAIASLQNGSDLSMPECPVWRAGSLQRITTQVHPKLIIVSSFNHYLTYQEELLQDWNTTLAILRRAHAPIVDIADTPFPGFEVPACMSSSLNDWSRCSFRQTRALAVDPVELASLAGNEPDVHMVNLSNYLCPSARCPAARDHVLFYRDDSHITATLSKLMAPALLAAMVQSKALNQNHTIRSEG